MEQQGQHLRAWRRQPGGPDDLARSRGVPHRHLGQRDERHSWSASDPDGIRSYLVRYSDNGGAWQFLCSYCTATSGTIPTVPGHSYTVDVAAQDNAGNLDAVYVRKTFTVQLFDNGSSSESASSGWSSQQASSAINGTYVTSSTTSAYRSLTFSGTDAALVSLKSYNLGQVQPWYDSTWDAIVDLYSSTFQGPSIVYAHHYTQAGNHTIGFQVVGTSGHPLVDEDAFLVLS